MDSTSGPFTAKSTESPSSAKLFTPPPHITTSLVTIFNPPASCFKDLILTLFTDSNDSTDGELGIAPVDTSCYPTEYKSGVTFSPGVCPSDYNWGSFVIDSVQSETIPTCWPP